MIISLIVSYLHVKINMCWLSFIKYPFTIDFELSMWYN